LSVRCVCVCVCTRMYVCVCVYLGMFGRICLPHCQLMFLQQVIQVIIATWTTRCFCRLKRGLKSSPGRCSCCNVLYLRCSPYCRLTVLAVRCAVRSFVRSCRYKSRVLTFEFCCETVFESQTVLDCDCLCSLRSGNHHTVAISAVNNVLAYFC